MSQSFEFPRANPFTQRTGVFETRGRAPDARSAALERQRREAERRASTEGERLYTRLDLQLHLHELNHERAERRCDINKPWTYLPILFQELFTERAGNNTAHELQRFRGLILAGSRQTHEPLTPRLGTRPRTPERLNAEEAYKRISTIRQKQADRWLARIRHADPSTSREYLEYLTHIQHELDNVERSLRAVDVGDSLEEAVRTIEDLEYGAWRELEKLRLAHGYTWEDLPQHAVATPWLEEIELLHPLRNFVYERRLYPKLAQTRAQRGSVKTT